MSSAKLRKISKTIEMVEIFLLKFARSPQLKLWVNSIHIIVFPAAAGSTVGLSMTLIT
jgi:hypothetical protein